MNYSSLRAFGRRWVTLALWWVPFWLSWWALMAGATVASAQTFLPVEQAFRLEVRASGPRAVQVSFVQAPGVYLYREQMTATWRAAGGAEQPLGWDLPPAESKFDPNFEKTVEVYHQSLQGGLTLPADARGEAVLTLGYQGCADAGICYPPQKRAFNVSLDAQGLVVVERPEGLWFLRGVISGQGVADPAAAEQIEEIYRSIVVVRGTTPMPPRDLIPLHMPATGQQA